MCVFLFVLLRFVLAGSLSLIRFRDSNHFGVRCLCFLGSVCVVVVVVCVWGGGGVQLTRYNTDLKAIPL